MVAKTRTAPAPVFQTPAAPAVDAPLSWDNIGPGRKAEYTRSNVADREATTPDVIKQHTQQAYFRYVAVAPVGIDHKPLIRSKALDASRWEIELPSEKHAEEWMKLMRKYAAFKGWTVRGGSDGKTVRFAVKPGESRQSA